MPHSYSHRELTEYFYEALDMFNDCLDSDISKGNLVLDYFLRKFQLMGDSPVLQFLSDNRMLIYAIVLILMMLFTSAPAFVAYREKILAGFRKDKADDTAKAKGV